MEAALFIKGKSRKATTKRYFMRKAESLKANGQSCLKWGLLKITLK
jgi:hypothetical protein